MGDERAETYLRRVAEAELRRAGHELRRIEAGPDGPGQELFAVASRAQWKVVRTGRILVAASALDREFVQRLASQFHVGLYVRSRFLLNWDRRRGVLVHSMAELPLPPPPPPPEPAVMMTTPIGQVLQVRTGRAPADLNFLVAIQIGARAGTGTEAVLTVAMRMHWPPDGSSADLEASGAGPHHLPYDQLSVVDEQGTRYSLRFESGSQGGQAPGGVWPACRRCPCPRSSGSA